jgi:hypothetical protein
MGGLYLFYSPMFLIDLLCAGTRFEWWWRLICIRHLKHQILSRCVVSNLNCTQNKSLMVRLRHSTIKFHWFLLVDCAAQYGLRWYYWPNSRPTDRNHLRITPSYWFAPNIHDTMRHNALLAIVLHSQFWYLMVHNISVRLLISWSRFFRMAFWTKQRILLIWSLSYIWLSEYGYLLAHV